TQQQQISIIASDVDGTLLNSQQQLTPAVEAAVKQAADAGVPLIVATGKARGPWVHQVLPRLGLALPGVFLQGLLIADAQGNVLHSRCLPDDVVASCIQLAAQHDITLTAYCNDRIFCKATDEHTNRRAAAQRRSRGAPRLGAAWLLWYKEPTPEPVGDLASHLLGSVETHKLIFMAPQAVIDGVRPDIEAALAGRASCTTALSGMLEVLPLGASKGAGVAWLLAHLGMEPAGLLALGDGENDIEMLRLAGVGVAMGNAGAAVKAAAAGVVGSNDEDGVAQGIHEYVLRPRGLSEGRAVVAAPAAAAAAAGGSH
ncbi:HAD-like domain-containing protein, partial [Scenedesmus sp. NREL 46B-D3]